MAKTETETKPSLQSIAIGANPGVPPHPSAVRHGSGGQYVAVGGGWLVPVEQYEAKAEKQKPPAEN